MPTTLASVMTVYGSVNIGEASTGWDVSADFSCSNAHVHCYDHVDMSAFLRSKLVRGAVISAYLSMNLQK